MHATPPPRGPVGRCASTGAHPRQHENLERLARMTRRGEASPSTTGTAASWPARTDEIRIGLSGAENWAAWTDEIRIADAMPRAQA